MITSGPEISGIRGREHQGGPTSLAVSDNDRLRCFWVATADLAHEFGFRAHDIGQRLVWLGMRAKDDEIDGVAVMKRDAHLTVELKAPYARAMAGARIDDHIGALPIEDFDAFGWQDLQKHVIDGPGQCPTIHRHLALVDKHRRRAGGLVLDVVVAPLAKYVERENETLRGVVRVLAGVFENTMIVRSVAEAAVERAYLVQKVLQPLAMGFTDLFDTTGIAGH